MGNTWSNNARPRCFRHARVAVERLSDFIDPRGIEAVPLAPGRHPLADINRALERRRAILGASIGAALGAFLIGAGVALAVLPRLGLCKPLTLKSRTIGVPRSPGSQPIVRVPIY